MNYLMLQISDCIGQRTMVGIKFVQLTLNNLPEGVHVYNLGTGLGTSVLQLLE